MGHLYRRLNLYKAINKDNLKIGSKVLWIFPFKMKNNLKTLFLSKEFMDFTRMVHFLNLRIGCPSID